MPRSTKPTSRSSVFDIDPTTADAFARACEAAGILFFRVDRSAIDGAPVMLARLFLNSLVPQKYRRFLYIDGDTQITGSLDRLLDTDMPDGKFLAANDPMTFALPGNDSHSRGIAEYFASLGMTVAESTNYFNTGVLLIARQGWDATEHARGRCSRPAHSAFGFLIKTF